jgi:hypothetical protein
MKIAFCITTLGHGRGGHFYDVKTISESLQMGECEISIVEMGLRKSPIIAEANIPVKNIYFNGLNFIVALIKLVNWIIKNNISVLHAYDNESYSLVRIAGILTKRKVALSKCGGANPKGYFPLVENLFLFSKENFNFFDGNDRYVGSKLFYTPNRVKAVVADFDGSEKLRGTLTAENVFMQVSRIDEHYRESLIQSVNLVNRLSMDGVSASLVIIGVIQSKKLLDDLLKADKENVIRVLTESEFTINAARLIPACDFYIGTGRGIMEAASLSKPVLTPIQHSKIPLLVTSDNVNSMISTNFSPRNCATSSEVDKGYADLIVLINNHEIKVSYQRVSKEWFDKYFDVNNIKQQYCEIYKSLTNHNVFVWDALLGGIATIKQLSLFYLRKK